MEWISVKKRLPNKIGEYLTCDRKGNIHIFLHSPEFKYPFAIDPKHPRFYMPTHWQPLPLPPKDCTKLGGKKNETD